MKCGGLSCHQELANIDHPATAYLRDQGIKDAGRDSD